ncbi:adenylate/guanylate cyclase domain-containing protein [Mucilaginibacter sp. PAMB04274]|uniref:adenylate/guanylate cyclase domain-containing protein n=1 Tax=Mucilaginibacter sp. PAMB04274 TaxID=3138568 RepID=UPI0031F6412D
MSNKLKYILSEISFIAIAWVVLTLVYVLVKFSDVPEPQIAYLYSLAEPVKKSWLFTVSLIVATPLGIVLGVMHTLVYPSFDRFKSLGFNILTRSFIFSMLAVTVFLLLLAVGTISNSSLIQSLQALFSKASVLNVFLYMLLVENFLGVVLLLRRGLGDRYFFNSLVNTYRNPKEEQRIFMFLDMEDSTPIGESLGYLKFSRYVQDCFYDLSDIVIQHGGEIYQFVGDEAVITWKISSNFLYQQCIDLYFAYMVLLIERESYYKLNYQTIPMFRCAIHCGTVSTSLVGNHKKEIAYHGTVLNLCARLQAIAKSLNACILVSDIFWDRVLEKTHYQAEQVHLESLKGLHHEQIAYKILKHFS